VSTFLYDFINIGSDFFFADSAKILHNLFVFILKLLDSKIIVFYSGRVFGFEIEISLKNYFKAFVHALKQVFIREIKKRVKRNRDFNSIIILDFVDVRNNSLVVVCIFFGCSPEVVALKSHYIVDNNRFKAAGAFLFILDKIVK
jgi:hypothetical protein